MQMCTILNGCTMKLVSKEDYKVELPALSKSQWEKLKRAGDYVFGEIGGD